MFSCACYCSKNLNRNVCFTHTVRILGIAARCSVLCEYLIMSSNICPEHVYKDHFPLVPRAVFIYKFDCIT